MRENPIEILAGLIVLLVAGGFIFYVTLLGEKQSGENYVIHAAFYKADGIRLGSEVRLAGIKIGVIGAQNLNRESYQAEIELLIQEDIAIPEDSVAKISADGFLGDKYITIDVGGSETMLEPGDFLENTQDSFDLYDLIGQFIFSQKNSPQGQ